jgi:hypothetical protein
MIREGSNQGRIVSFMSGIGWLAVELVAKPFNNRVLYHAMVNEEFAVIELPPWGKNDRSRIYC